MKVRVRYFALLREAAGVEGEDLDWVDGEPTVGRLRAHLCARSPGVASVLRERPVLCAVNREYAAPDVVLAEGDEVAFFPPVTGG